MTTTILTTPLAMKSILILSIIALTAATPDVIVGLDPVDMSMFKKEDSESDGSRVSFGAAGNSRIVGGDESEPGEFPYFVEMGGCGGALIAPDIVLFAAHCNSGFLNKQLNIGGYKTRTEYEGSKSRFCEEWIPDPLYGSGGSDVNYDFALCKLDAPVSIDNSRYKVKIELNFESSVPENGENLTVFGLGTTSYQGSQATTLKDVQVPYLTNEECNREDRYDGDITDAMLCAGFPDFGGKDSCQGDSGGPLVKRQYLEDGTILDTHVGVVSWGKGCAWANYPGVYARTSVRADWIKETMCETMGSMSDLCNDDESGDESNDENNEFDIGTNADIYGAPTGFQTITCDGENEQKLLVDFNTDAWAYETAWQLRLEDTKEEIKLRKYLINNFNYKTEVCLASNTCYEWEVRDLYGDGMCSFTGCGSWTLTLNEDQIVGAGNGNFASVLIESFCTGDSPSNDVGSISDSNDSVESMDSVDSNDSVESMDSVDSNASVDSNESLDSFDNSGDPPPPTCDNNANLRFAVQVMSDDDPTQISIGAYLLNEGLTEYESTVFDIQQGVMTQQRGLYLLPDAGEYYCLELNRCYMFIISDSHGDGMDDGGYYKGFLGNDEIFSGSGNFGNIDEHFFCTGTATLPPTLPPSTKQPTGSPTGPSTGSPTKSTTGSPTEPPTEAVTFVPTTFPTQVPSSLPTEEPTQLPTEAPTEPVPTEAPTSFPTKSPTNFPTETPTNFPTETPTEAPTPPQCLDDPDFKWKGKKTKTCEKFLKENAGSRKIRKKCKKNYGDGQVCDYCAETCAEKADMGPCSTSSDEKANATNNTNKKRRKREFNSSADVDSFNV